MDLQEYSDNVKEASEILESGHENKFLLTTCCKPINFKMNS